VRPLLWQKYQRGIPQSGLKCCDFDPITLQIFLAVEMTNHPSRSHGPEELATLARVLEEAVRTILETTGSPATDAALHELRTRVGKVIMDRVAAGETDPELLKQAAVKSILEG